MQKEIQHDLELKPTYPVKDLYTVKEVSEILIVNVNVVYNLIKSGTLKALKLGRYKITSAENNQTNNSSKEDIKYLNFIRDLLKDKVAPYKVSSIRINDHLNICLYPNHFICDIYLDKTPHQIKIANKEYGSISFDFDEIEDLNEIQDIFLSALDIYK